MKWENRQRKPTLRRNNLRLGGHTVRRFEILRASLLHCTVVTELFKTRLGEDRTLCRS